MGNIASHNGDVPGGKGEGIPGKFHGAAVGLAQTDFQTIVKMESAGRHVGNMPFITPQQNNGKISGQQIIAVFYCLMFWSGQRKNLPVYRLFYSCSAAQ